MTIAYCKTAIRKDGKYIIREEIFVILYYCVCSAGVVSPKKPRGLLTRSSLRREGRIRWRTHQGMVSLRLGKTNLKLGSYMSLFAAK